MSNLTMEQQFQQRSIELAMSNLDREGLENAILTVARQNSALEVFLDSRGGTLEIPLERQFSMQKLAESLEGMNRDELEQLLLQKTEANMLLRASVSQQANGNVNVNCEAA